MFKQGHLAPARYLVKMILGYSLQLFNCFKKGCLESLSFLTDLSKASIKLIIVHWFKVHNSNNININKSFIHQSIHENMQPYRAHIIVLHYVFFVHDVYGITGNFQW
jgi:hypothetical protein